MTHVDYMLHFPSNNRPVSALQVCLCFIRYEFLIIPETHWVVNCLFQPSNIIFLHQKMVIFYCKFLLPPSHPLNLLIFSKQLYSLFTFNSMFYNENNDFIGEQYELVKLKYSSIISCVQAVCVCMKQFLIVRVCVCAREGVCVRACVLPVHCNLISLYPCSASPFAPAGTCPIPRGSPVTWLSHQH